MITVTNTKVNLTEQQALIFQQITEYYPDLQYIEGKDTIYFVGKDLELAKGRAGDHFYRSYQTYSKNNKDRAQQYSKSPQVLILEKDILKSYKQKYENKYGISLGSVNRLIVVNLSAAHYYLELEMFTNTNNNEYIEYETMLNEVIQQTEQLQQIKEATALEYRQKKELPPLNIKTVPIQSEIEISKELSNLSSFTQYPYRREMTVVNQLDDQVARTRRYDLYRELPNHIEVIEIKKNPLSTEDIAITLGDKGYLHLLPQQTKATQFIFIAPSILPSALRLLEHLNSNIQYRTIEEHIRELLIEIKDSLPSAGKWYLKEVIKEISLLTYQQFEDLV